MIWDTQHRDMVNPMPEFFRLEMGLPMQQSHHLICPGCDEIIGAWAGPPVAGQSSRCAGTGDKKLADLVG